MSQFHFNPDTYLDLMRAEVPAYARLQEAVAEATEGMAATRILDLGTGTGETLAAVLAVHPAASAVGVDESESMLAAAQQRLSGVGAGVEFHVADLRAPLPPGPFDLVVSALAVHHLDGPAKADLFARVQAVLRPGGRFVLADVVIPVDPDDAVTPQTPEYDRPSTTADQLAWLVGAGLVAVPTWAERDLVVLRADRPG
jgi:tRNA (cmo5U34)-methyltransferase